MHIKSDTMAKAVAKSFTVTRFGDYRSCGLINIRSSATDFDFGYSSLLRLKDEILHILLPRSCLADDNRTGHISAIAFVHRSKVESDEITFGDLFVRCNTVRQS